MGVLVFSATWRIIECTILLLLYRSSHLTMSSGDTLRFERSMYPAAYQLLLILDRPSAEKSFSPYGGRTLVFIHPKHNDDLIPPHSDELLYTPYSTPRKLTQQYHTIDIVIFQ